MICGLHAIVVLSETVLECSPIHKVSHGSMHAFIRSWRNITALGFHSSKLKIETYGTLLILHVSRLANLFTSDLRRLERLSGARSSLVGVESTSPSLPLSLQSSSSWSSSSTASSPTPSSSSSPSSPSSYSRCLPWWRKGVKYRLHQLVCI